jgi:CheY-like chemotaxis protein
MGVDAICASSMRRAMPEVLLIDDNKEILSANASQLVKDGFTVTAAPCHIAIDRSPKILYIVPCCYY